jgi:RNA polymerase sigma factor (sigma-70 family)
MATNDDRPVPADQFSPSTPTPSEDCFSPVAMRTAWVEFYDHEYQPVVRFVVRLGAGLEDARDAAGEAFTESLVLVNREPEKWAQIEDKRSWVRSVVLRKYKRPPGKRIQPLVDKYADIPELPDPGLEPGELTAQTQAVLQELHKLDEETRTVMAYYMDRFPAAVTANELGITEQRVRDLTKKARATLKRNLSGMRTLEGRDAL